MEMRQNHELLREIIRIIVRKLGLLQKTDAACCGITVGQCHALVEIGRARTLSLNELAEILALDKSTMSRTVDNLVNGGLVERNIDKGDRRYTTLNLTVEGTTMVEFINCSMNEYFDRVLSAVPKEKLAVVIEILPYLLTAVEKTDMCFVRRTDCLNQVSNRGVGSYD